MASDIPEQILTAREMLLVEQALAMLMARNRGAANYAQISRLLNAVRSAVTLILVFDGARTF